MCSPMQWKYTAKAAHGGRGIPLLDCAASCSFWLFMIHNYAIIVSQKGENVMPIIMPIKDLRNTTEISNIAHKEQEPIFITKNGYSDLVVMSSKLYDKFAKTNRIDQAIYESEQEISNGAEAVDAEVVFAELEKKNFR